jgi:hypothetical protein
MDASALESAESWLAVIWWVKLVAAGLVAVGVAMEFGGDWIAAPFEKTVSDARKLEISRLSSEAESARAIIADAVARAKEADQKAEAEKLERVKLQEKIAWRSLTGEQQKNVSSKIRPFAGQQYLLAVSGDPESANFLPTIDAILKDAGWVRLPPSGALLTPDGTASIGIKSKIVILVAESKQAELGPRVLEFVKALSDEGIAASAGYDPANKNSPDVIEITVGSKPQ